MNKNRRINESVLKCKCRFFYHNNGEKTEPIFERWLDENKNTADR